MALIRRSPSNRSTVSPYATSGQATLNQSVSNPYYTGSTQQQVSLQNYATKYKVAQTLPANATQEQILTKAQQSLTSRTSYLQPTTGELAKGQFGQFGSDITYEEYVSQRTSLSAIQSIGKQLGIQTAASGPVGVSFTGGVRQVTNTPEQYAKFQQDIQLEEMFGMMGSGSAGNIRLATALTGAPTEKLISYENKYLGIRQEQPVGKAAFSYSGQTFDVQGNLVGSDSVRGKIQLEGPKATEFMASLATEATQVAAELKPSGGTVNLTEAFGIKVGENLTKATPVTALPTNIIPAPAVTASDYISGRVESVRTLGETAGPQQAFAKNTGIETTVVPISGIDAGAQYRKDFIAQTGVDIWKPLIAPKEVRAIKDITGISQGKEPTLFYPDFLGKLTAPGELKGGKLEGVRYADLYQPKSPGSTTLVLSQAGQAFRNLQIKGTPSINVRLR